MKIAGTLLVMLCMALQQDIFAQSKMGYVDVQKVMDSLKETEAAKKHMQAEQEKYAAQFQYLQDSLNTSQDDYIKNVKDNTLLKDGAKKAIEKGIQELAYYLQTFNQRANEDLGKKQQELMQPILDKVKKAVETVRKTEGYDFVFHSDVVFVSDSKFDITQKTIDELIKMAGTKDKK